MINMPEPVVAHDVHVSLDGVPVLNGVDLAVRAGEVVALLGGNGAGKTTLLRAVLGLVPLTAGEVKLFGQAPAQFRDWGAIGYVPQRGSVQIGTATVGELVASGRLPHRRVFRPLRAEDKTAIADALAMVGLTGLSRQPVANLSGGQRQRALIARALATRPRLIVLDEPLAGLDTTTQDSLADVLAGLAGTSILVVLHELGPLEPLLSRGVVLKQGEVIYDGPLSSAPGASAHDTGHEHGQPAAGPEWAIAPLARGRRTSRQPGEESS